MRIIRACREMGIRTGRGVLGSRRARAARAIWPTTSLCIGPAPSTESYLKIARGDPGRARRPAPTRFIPAYGFLSQNASFAAACEAAS